VTRPTGRLSCGSACAAILALALSFHPGGELRAQNAKPGKAAPAVPVSVATVRRQTVPVRIRAIGNAEAYTTVALKARVDGQIVAVNFKEGMCAPPAARC
jgi:multidrug efflux system membrane fusion protein